jgi:N-acetylglucosaminyl-diphospho-decaprenol L-rhamnosyltransferase
VDISFTIVEYFCLDTLREAVQSIFAHPWPGPFEIIVVSNSAYSQEQQLEIGAKFPQVEFIFNQHNAGFGKGVNQGIRKSSGKYVMLLNPDAKLTNQSLANAVKFMDAHGQVAVIGPLIVDHTGQVQDSCREFMTFGIMLKRMFKRIAGRSHGGVLDNKDYFTAHRVDWVSGACLLARKEAITQAGLLDERYFMYVEDMDWCRNFYKHGWLVWFLPDWQVEHNAGRASSGRLGLVNKLMWIHFMSFCKYNIKWFNG